MSALTPEITVTDTPAPDDIALISDSLDAFNVGETGVDDRVPLAVLVRDPTTGKTIGGLTGRTSLGLLFIDLVYLPPELRGSGVGSRILAAAEEEGRRRGCRSAIVYTISFQAPEFYQKRGWQVFGEIPSDPDDRGGGISRVFLTKTL